MTQEEEVEEVEEVEEEDRTPKKVYPKIRVVEQP